MSLSFWVNVAICIGALLSTWLNHSELGAAIEDAVDAKERRRKCTERFLLWFVTVFSLVALPITAWESITSDARLEEVQTKVLELEAAARDRDITPTQHADLVQMLLPAAKGPVAVRSDWLNSEARKYADQIKSVLTEAGFELVPCDANVISTGNSGVTIIAHDLESTYGAAIQKAFAEIGEYVNSFRATTNFDNFFSSNSQAFVIWVSRKRDKPMTRESWLEIVRTNQIKLK